MHTNTELITQWAAFLLTEKRVSKNTYLSYIADINQLSIYTEKAGTCLAALSQEAIHAYIHFLSEQKLKESSIARKVIAVRLFFSFLHKRYGYQNNADQLIIPKLEHRLPKYLTEEEIARLLSVSYTNDSPLSKRNHLIINLLYATGLRISELAHLTLANLRCNEGTLQVMGKGNKERIIPVPEQTIHLLKEYIDTVLAHFLRTEVQKGTEYLFPVLYGNKIKPISRQCLWIIIKKLCIEAGIQKNVSPHQLRHSLATHLLKYGADLRSIQVLLGHEKLSSVQIYTHVERSHIRVIYDKKHPRS